MPGPQDVSGNGVVAVRDVADPAATAPPGPATTTPPVTTAPAATPSAPPKLDKGAEPVSPAPALVHQQTEGVSYVLLDTIPLLKEGIAELRATMDDSTVALDLEGEDLGRYGRIGTLALCPHARGVVYIVDVAVLGDSAFEWGNGLRELLESPDVLKILFDCRADLNALYFNHRVRVPAESVLDIQLYDTAYRCIAKDEWPGRLGGLAWLLANTPAAGMTGNERVRMDHVKSHAKSLFAPEYGGSYRVWMRRPLRPLLIEYACYMRFFHNILDYYEARLGDDFDDAIVRATERRVAEARSTNFDAGYSGNVRIDPKFRVGLWRALGEPGPPPRPPLRRWYSYWDQMWIEDEDDFDVDPDLRDFGEGRWI